MLLFEGSPFYIGMAVILLSMLILKVARKKRYPFLLFYFVFCVYVLHVLKYTLFPIPVDPRVIAIHAGPTIDFSKGINLIPFSDSSMRNGFDREMLLNVLMTIPFGFGIPFLTRIHLKKLVLVGLTVGVTIELLQLFLSLMLGFPYRYVDINDVIHNFTGVLFGFLLFKIFAWLFTVSVERVKLPPNALLAYMHEVCSRSRTNTREENADSSSIDC